MDGHSSKCFISWDVVFRDNKYYMEKDEQEDGLSHTLRVESAHELGHLIE